MFKKLGLVIGGGLVGIAGYGIHAAYKSHFEFELVDDKKFHPFVSLQRSNDKSFFGHVAGKTQTRIRVSRTLFEEFGMPGVNMNLSASMTIDGGIKQQDIDKYMYTLSDTLMAIPVILKNKKDGTNKGVATSYINEERKAELIPGEKYYMAVSCYRNEGRDYYTICQVVDSDYKLVRTYRGKFVRVDWPIKFSTVLVPKAS